MIKNVILISADFPKPYYQFAKAFRNNGCNVFVIGSTQWNELQPELKEYATEYYQSYEINNIDKLCEIVGYFQNKYGHIDFLESNNEFWLRSDSIVRERFGIDTGIYPFELDEYQRKSSMKKAFLKAGAHVAPFLLVDDLKSLKEFANKYHYPLFAKPDIGVGAAGNYKINNLEELENFYNEKPNVQYICEAFVEGQIVTFDGIANADSEPVVMVNEIFPREIYNLHITKEDMIYYVNKEVPEKIEKLGKNIIKCLGLKNRFFHTELFIAENDCEGCFKKGDIVPIEVNIRTPGGYTPDLLNFGLSSNVYQMFADIICFGKTNQTVGPRFYAMCASRRRGKDYFFTEEDILRTFKNNLCSYGEYPDIISDLMGNRFYMAKFDKKEDADIFAQYVKRRASESLASVEKSVKRLIGEDKRILDDRKNETFDDGLSICDKHIDGA